MNSMAQLHMPGNYLQCANGKLERALYNTIINSVVQLLLDVKHNVSLPWGEMASPSITIIIFNYKLLNPP